MATKRKKAATPAAPRAATPAAPTSERAPAKGSRTKVQKFLENTGRHGHETVKFDDLHSIEQITDTKPAEKEG